MNAEDKAIEILAVALFCFETDPRLINKLLKNSEYLLEFSKDQKTMSYFSKDNFRKIELQADEIVDLLLAK